MSQLSSIDLFAGAGGLSYGLTTEGFKVAVAVELDPVAAASYALNHKNTKVLIEDIRNIRGPWLLQQAGIKRGELDLLTGCPPCQGFSSLRTRRREQSSDDPRNDLIGEILRLVRSTRPRALVIENVPGLAKDSRFQDFRRGLKKSGYPSDYAIINASDFGVPQRRKRLVLIAFRGKNPPSSWSNYNGQLRTVRETIGHLETAGKSGDPLHDIPEKRTPEMMVRIKATPKDGGSRSDLPTELQCECHLRKGSGYFDVYGRMAWDQVSPTITSGCTNPSKGRFLHPDENRAITLREAALLQTFPADYQFSPQRGKDHIARQIGNAFPPVLIQPIARVISHELQSQ